MRTMIEGLEPCETMSREQLVDLQLKRLKSSLSYTYSKVAYYRDKCKEIGIHPLDLFDLSDLSKFPFTTKSDLRSAFPFGSFAVSSNDIVRLHASSGTTGPPTVVGYTSKDIETWSTLMERSIRAAGGRRSDIIQISFGYGLFTGGLGAHYGAEKLGATVIPLSGGHTERQVQFIRDIRPDIIMATPSYLLVIADELDRQGVDSEDCSIGVAIAGAEPWTNDLRTHIEHRFGASALDHYGLSEVIGPGVAQECIEAKDGLHIWEDHFYPEIIDPDTGQVLPEGTFGELVLTSLTREAMPVIRYRTKDLTCLLPGTCRPMRRIAKISGRTDDMMIIRGVNVFPSQIEEMILADERLSPHFQLELGKSGHLDSLCVVVESSSQLALDGATVAGADLGHRIKSLIGITVDVSVVRPDTLARFEGKAQRVIDCR